MKFIGFGQIQIRFKKGHIGYNGSKEILQNYAIKSYIKILHYLFEITNKKKYLSITYKW